MIFYASSILLPQQIAILFRRSASTTGWISVSTSFYEVLFGNSTHPYSSCPDVRASVEITDGPQCTISGGLNVGFVLSGAFSHKIKHVKWQLAIASILLTAFIGAVSAADGSNLAIPVVFTLIGAFSIGWIEVLVGSAGPLSLDAKDIGVANGVQWGLRTLTSSFASE